MCGFQVEMEGVDTRVMPPDSSEEEEEEEEAEEEEAEEPRETDVDPEEEMATQLREKASVTFVHNTSD
eukprot:SAG11_NODE_10042_length_861_cov_1.154856_1_plen_68_part_00